MNWYEKCPPTKMGVGRFKLGRRPMGCSPWELYERVSTADEAVEILARWLGDSASPDELEILEDPKNSSDNMVVREDLISLAWERMVPSPWPVSGRGNRSVRKMKTMRTFTDLRETDPKPFQVFPPKPGIVCARIWVSPIDGGPGHFLPISFSSLSKRRKSGNKGFRATFNVAGIPVTLGYRRDFSGDHSCIQISGAGRRAYIQALKSYYGCQEFHSGDKMNFLCRLFQAGREICNDLRSWETMPKNI